MMKQSPLGRGSAVLWQQNGQAMLGATSNRTMLAQQADDVGRPGGQMGKISVTLAPAYG
ncbi:MAG: hypothetical protein H6669_01440 [Ardenticatenaceae bacterium]|nr:hypothetical protein [Ardenticatenaceae bacterium]